MLFNFEKKKEEEKEILKGSPADIYGEKEECNSFFAFCMNVAINMF